MIVTRDQLEAGLARARAQAGSRDPRAGIHGPGSITWEWNRELVNFLGGGRAILLQLAHPAVAAAIDQHSTVQDDARARFERTFAGVFAMTFGDVDQAFAAARRVHLVHTKIHGEVGEDVGRYRKGDRYRASDPAALLWVHATLLDSVIAVREHVFGRQEPGDLESYYQESKRFACLFGIPDSMIPEDYAAYRAYFDRALISGEIAVGGVARALMDFVLAPPFRGTGPLMQWYRVMTAGLLPEQLREGYGLRFGRVDRALFRAAPKAIAPLVRVMPRQVRYLPAYLEAELRVGQGSRRLLGRAADRIAATGVGIWPRPG